MLQFAAHLLVTAALLGSLLVTLLILGVAALTAPRV